MRIQLCTWLQYDSNMHMFYRDHSANVSFIAKSTGCKGQYPFLRLPNHDAMKQTVPDGMHTIRDAIVNIFDIIIGKDDTDSCRKCEINLGRPFGMTSETLQTKINRKEPIVTYSLSSADIKLADTRSEAIISPQHIDFVPGKYFSKPSALKSHDWKQVR